jgi:hypothetical protein
MAVPKKCRSACPPSAGALAACPPFGLFVYLSFRPRTIRKIRRQTSQIATFAVHPVAAREAVAVFTVARTPLARQASGFCRCRDGRSAHLSPEKIGATLLWYVEEPCRELLDACVSWSETMNAVGHFEELSGQPDAAHSSWLAPCPGCGKTSRVEAISTLGRRERERAACEACGTTLAERCARTSSRSRGTRGRSEFPVDGADASGELGSGSIHDR